MNDNKIRKYITPRKISSVTLGMLMLALVGIFQFLSLKCSLEALKTADFWLRLLYRAILVFLSYSAALDFVYDRNMSAVNMQDARNTLETLLKMRQDNFGEYLTIRNRNVKIKTYKELLIKKIGSLEKQAGKMKFRNNHKLDIINSKIAECRKQMTDEYIEEHIDTLKVKYTKAYESDFISLELLEGKGNHDKLNPDYGRLRAKATIKKVVPFLLISTVLGMAITTSVSKPVLDVLINLISDLMLIVVRISHGLYDSKPLIEESYLIPYNNKIRILKEYVNWNNDPNSKANRILQLLEEQKEQKEETNND